MLRYLREHSSLTGLDDLGLSQSNSDEGEGC